MQEGVAGGESAGYRADSTLSVESLNHVNDLRTSQTNILLNQNLKRNLKFHSQASPEAQQVKGQEEGASLAQDPTQDFIPTIGIITQPVSEAKKETFDYHDYILEVNDNFVSWAGSRTVAIPFDIAEKDLLPILDQINGVLLTGGQLTLIDEEGTQHPYYRTARRVIEYSKARKDERGEDWPVLGICQGLEVMAVY